MTLDMSLDQYSWRASREHRSARRHANPKDPELPEETYQWQVDHIEAAIDEADANRFASDADVQRAIRRLIGDDSQHSPLLKDQYEHRLPE
jgi:hypothetical protein